MFKSRRKPFKGKAVVKIQAVFVEERLSKIQTASIVKEIVGIEGRGKRGRGRNETIVTELD